MKSLNDTITLQQDLLHNPAYLITPLIAVVSLVGAIAMTWRKAPFTLEKWRNDEYFRLKFSLGISLVLNSSIDLLYYLAGLSPYASTD